MSRNTGTRGLGVHFLMKHIIVEIWALNMQYTTQTKLACHQHLVSAFFLFKLSICGLISKGQKYTKIKLWKVITYEHDFLIIKTSIALSYEMRVTTQFNHTSNIYTKSDILTKRLVLLPVDYSISYTKIWF